MKQLPVLSSRMGCLDRSWSFPAQAISPTGPFCTNLWFVFVGNTQVWAFKQFSCPYTNANARYCINATRTVALPDVLDNDVSAKVLKALNSLESGNRMQQLNSHWAQNLKDEDVSRIKTENQYGQLTFYSLVSGAERTSICRISNAPQHFQWSQQ